MTDRSKLIRLIAALLDAPIDLSELSHDAAKAIGKAVYAAHVIPTDALRHLRLRLVYLDAPDTERQNLLALYPGIDKGVEW